MKTVAFFNDADPQQSGGKGKSLVTLTRASFPVPPGFIVTFPAWKKFHETGKMSIEVEDAVCRCYRKLRKGSGSPYVAVRSSAAAEDGKAASFAGQYDTFLYVSSQAELLKRIVDCWLSLSGQEAALYRERLNIPAKNLDMAVVVQTMVEARSAGVLFTARAHTGQTTAGDEKIMVVESAWGCGESVVSGRVTPDYFEVARDGGARFVVGKKILGQKESALKGAQGRQPTSPQEQEQYSLTDQELIRLCRCGARIEDLFGCPQDVEWAVDHEERLFILQARPITTIGSRAREND